MNNDKLYKELESWLDTPFRHRCGVKGMGCDCIHLVIRVLERFGYGPFKIPDYARDWHLHKTSGTLMKNLMKQIPSAYEVDMSDIKDGDVILWHVGKDTAHAGMYCRGYVYHSVSGIGVIKIPWKSALEFQKNTMAISHVMRVF